MIDVKNLILTGCWHVIWYHQSGLFDLLRSPFSIAG